MTPTKAAKARAAAAAAAVAPPTESDANLLAMLQSTVACLKDKRMDVEALGCMEQALWLQRRMLGVESVAVRRALHEVVLSTNSLAMQFLALGQFDQCLAMLRKAEAITAPGNFVRCEALQILTYNNLGCCYRKLGKLKSALKYLTAAAQLGAGAAHVRNLSITHLNLCAIQSQLGRHDLALEHAQAAIFHTQEELVQLDEAEQKEKQQQQKLLQQQGRSRRKEDEVEEEEAEAEAELLTLTQDALDPKTREEKIVSLAVAYHNLAVELEFNGRGDASLQWYKKAAQLADKYKATNAALCESFHRIFLDAKRKYDASASAQHKAAPAAVPSFKPKSKPTAKPHAQAPASASGPARDGRNGARPRSAHAASRKDLSFNATVAANCYKPTKPSTAGLRYFDTASKPQPPQQHQHQQRLARVASTASCQSQSQTSGTSSRRRPLSASGARATASRQAAASRAAVRPSSARPRPSSARVGAGRVVVSRQRAEEDADGDDDEDDDEVCGVIDDDGDDDDDDDELSRFPVSAPESGRRIQGNSKSPMARARHRRVLRETRDLEVSEREEGEEEDEEDYGNESSARTTSRGGYSAEDDDTEAAEAERDRSSNGKGSGNGNGKAKGATAPAQRLSHMEYLRRMKALAETIRDDLDDRPIAASSLSSAVPASASVASVSTVAPSSTSTPRGSSKVRERLELVRRDSVHSLTDKETERTRKDDDGGLVMRVVLEDRVVADSELDAARAEHALVLAASARRVQTSLSANAARRRVRRLQRVRPGCLSVSCVGS
ncbi:hypothetical protein PINS_up004973 [Pythium insidiosum]|nr:hypothetical protein PINS_up004973 [Pythium insidiosum]